MEAFIIELVAFFSSEYDTKISISSCRLLKMYFYSNSSATLFDFVTDWRLKIRIRFLAEIIDFTHHSIAHGPTKSPTQLADLLGF